MLLQAKKIIGLSVITQGGDELGEISSFDVELDSQDVWQYHVRPSSLVSRLLGPSEELIVSREQVIRLDEKKMVVDDSLVKEKAGVPAKSKGLPERATVAPTTSNLEVRE